MRATFPRYLAALAVVALVIGLQPVPAAARPSGGLPPRAAAQIAALGALKASRTPAQAKLQSTLLTAVQLRSGRRLPAGVSVQPSVHADRAGRVGVDIRAAVTTGLLHRIRDLGGIVRSSSTAEHLVRADLGLSALQPLAALPDVQQIRSSADQYTTGRIPVPSPPLTKAQRGADLRRRLAAGLAARTRTHPSVRAGNAVTQGSAVSEGDRTHGADTARAQYHVSGVGITVGVLSDGVDSLQAAIATGDLPPTARALPGAEGSGDEGTAMMEIVHDLAPKADLVFATADTSELDFAANIRALRAAGADVIVDDVMYYDESPFQDGPIASAVADVTRDGATYFSSAGNQGNVDDHTSGNYEGDFHTSGRSVGKYAGVAHDFNPGAPVQSEDPVSAGSSGAVTTLQWADPLHAASDDYDLYAVDADGNVLAFSNDVQNGDDDPFERLSIPDGPSVRLVVVKFSGSDRYFQLTSFGGRFVDDQTLKGFATPGAVRGHSSVPGAYSVAAVPAAAPLPFDLEPGDPPNPPGPFPGLFSSTQLSERFTADGPRRMFFTAAGQPYTPGNLTSTGGRVRRDPDLTAADGVTTSLPDFTPFFGTSAAAPHAAALAALALSGHPGLSRARLRSALTSSAWDIEQPGRDRDTGAGVISAAALLAAAHVKGQPYVVPGDAEVTTSTDGDAYLEPGETAQVTLAVTNRGDVTAHDVRVRLSTPAAGITITPASSGYGDVAADGSKAESFLVSVARDLAPGTSVRLDARARFRGSYSPQRHTSTILVGQPGPVVTASYTGPAVPIPDDAPGAGATVSLPVHGVGPAISGVTFSIDGTSCSATEGSTTVGLDHTFDGDLVATLTAPDGTAVRLLDRTGESGNNFCQTVFTDAAPRPIQLAGSDDAPFTGSWQPAAPLSALLGRSGDGTWKLTVEDDASNDTGFIRAVSVHVSGYLPAGSTSRSRSLR